MILIGCVDGDPSAHCRDLGLGVLVHCKMGVSRSASTVNSPFHTDLVSLAQSLIAWFEHIHMFC